MDSCNCNNKLGFTPYPWAQPSCTPQPSSGCGLKTIVIPLNKGTDADGQPYAPKLGAWTCTLVRYMANGALYLYDSEGVFTKLSGEGGGSAVTGPLTAGEYDALTLTTSAYDGQALTATQYDTNAKLYLTR